AIEHNRVPAGQGESLRIQVAIGQIREEHSAKEKNLGRQKGPHSERGSLFLLRHVVELLGDGGRRVSHVAFPPLIRGNIDRADRSRRAFPRSYVSLAVTGFAIRDRWRSTD